MKKSRKLPRKLLIARCFKAGLSVAQVVWVFQVPEKDVHKAIRSLL